MIKWMPITAKIITVLVKSSLTRSKMQTLKKLLTTRPLNGTGTDVVNFQWCGEYMQNIAEQFKLFTTGGDVSDAERDKYNEDREDY